MIEVKDLNIMIGGVTVDSFVVCPEIVYISPGEDITIPALRGRVTHKSLSSSQGTVFVSPMFDTDRNQVMMPNIEDIYVVPNKPTQQYGAMSEVITNAIADLLAITPELQDWRTRCVEFLDQISWDAKCWDSSMLIENGASHRNAKYTKQ